MSTPWDTPRNEATIRVKIPPCSVKDCQLSTDVVLESCDGVAYGAHSVNLEAYSAGFPPAASTQFAGEIVYMPEDSIVLSLLLQYMHNERQPDTSKIPFDELASSSLSEAVEKYMVFSAMEVCRIRMQEAIPRHPFEVLAYAVKHGYPELSKVAAPLTLSKSFHDVSSALEDHPDMILRWVKYREHWLDVLSFIYEIPTAVLHRGGLSECENWINFHRQVLLNVGTKVNKLQEFDNILLRETRENLSECSHCRTRVGLWSLHNPCLSSTQASLS